MSIGARIYAELQGDKVIWMIVAVLAIFSILAVYSATSSMAYGKFDGDTEGMLMSHLVFLIMGLFTMYLAYLTHYEKYKVVAPFLMLIVVPLLVYTLFFGVEINGARRWIKLPFIARTFQTSDFAKLALILYVAREITRHKDYIKDFNRAFMPIIIPVLIVCGLIAPADLSTSMILLGTCLGMMFLGRVSIKYIALLLLLWMFLFTSLVAMAHLDIFPETIRLDTWMNRLAEFRSGGDSFQVEQSKIAIANGGLFGVGPGNSIQRNFLPSGYADYIYAIICEEYGLIGAFMVLVLYVMLFFRVTALVSKDPVKAFGMMVALGLTLNLVVQALVNMAVAVDLVPVTGLTLPFISKGGTSLIFTSIFFGIILSVSKNVERSALLGRTAQPEIQQTANAQKEAAKGGSGQSQGGSRSSGNRDNRSRGGGDNRQSGGSRSGGGNKDRREGGGNRSGGGGNRDNRNRGGGGGNRSGGGNRDNRNRSGGGGNRQGGGNRDNRGGGGNRK